MQANINRHWGGLMLYYSLLSVLHVLQISADASKSDMKSVPNKAPTPNGTLISASKPPRVNEHVKHDVCHMDTATFATVKHLITDSLSRYWPHDAAQGFTPIATLLETKTENIVFNCRAKYLQVRLRMGIKVVSHKLGQMYGGCWNGIIGRDFSYYTYWTERDYCFYFECGWWQAVLVAKQPCPGDQQDYGDADYAAK